MRKVLLGSAILCLALATVEQVEAQARGLRGVSGGVGAAVGRGPAPGIGHGPGPGRTGLVDRVQGRWRGGSPHGGWSGTDWRPGPRGNGLPLGGNGLPVGGNGIPVGGDWADRTGRWGGSPGGARYGNADRGGWNGGSHRDWQGSDRGDRPRGAEHGRGREGRGRWDIGGGAYADGIGIGDGWASAEASTRTEAPPQAGTGATWRNPCRSFWWDGWSWRC
ncbi:hypothetical protein [Allosphingosinicella deserti]|uniref:Uncharacterized protein n=1 Tax=Allosphingosinicella deserti TaxID=2116704 RepID=A0A2P7QKF2_9SPHN|nr:hypothetical protein [Sphingomonas deserti]PSJ38410.1 hypothetical protein C7I55_18365 [Sphingomonas deserti]